MKANRTTQLLDGIFAGNVRLRPGASRSGSAAFLAGRAAGILDGRIEAGKLLLRLLVEDDASRTEFELPADQVEAVEK